jgi:hypothetical protein
VIAGNFVLQLLRDYYTRDVVITADQIVGNGNEQLAWYSPAGGYRGITQFRRIGLHTLVILTMIVDNDYRETYQDLRDRTMNILVKATPNKLKTQNEPVVDNIQSAYNQSFWRRYGGHPPDAA